MNLVNAEIADNTAGYGGGIEVLNGEASLVLVNAAVHGDRADFAGGIDAFMGEILIQSSTFTGNDAAIGGGIHVGEDAIVTATNTTFAGNGPGTGADALIKSELATGGGLILGAQVCLYSRATLPVATVAAAADLFADIDPLTGGGLAGGHGGFGRTVALRASAYNPRLGGAVTDGWVEGRDEFDLDGDGDRAERLSQAASGAARNRIQADVGALEAAPLDTPSPIVTPIEDVADENDGVISLREAIASASSGALSGTITFDAALDSGEGAGAPRLRRAGGERRTTGEVAIDGDIDGDGVADVTLGGQGMSRVMSVTSGGAAVLNGEIVPGGDIAASGGGWFGGGIHVVHASLDLCDSVIEGNEAATGGGGLHGGFASLRVANTEIHSNGPGSGGGVYVRDCNLEMGSVTIAENAASGNVGGIRVDPSQVTLANLTVSDNTARLSEAGASFHGARAR